MKITNIATFFLAAVVLLTLLFACGGDSGSGTPGGDAMSTQEANQENAGTEADTTRASSGVADALDFDGAEFRQIYPYWQGYRYYFFADEENGDVMNDAVYMRKARVEEELNVKISAINGNAIGDIPTAVIKTVKAGEDAYQQVFLHCIAGVSQLSSGGYLFNVDNLPYISLDSDWWNKNQMDVLRLGSNTYFCVNDMMIPCPYVMFFNKGMIENCALDNPYQLVYDQKWTLDRLTDMAKAVVEDINGDGVMDENDQTGITANEISKYISFVTSAGQFITEKNADGEVSLAMNTPKMIDIVERFYQLGSENAIYLCKNPEEEYEFTMNSDRVLFNIGAITQAESMRGYDVEFGMLPYPKYDEAQPDYLSMDWGGLMCVPTTAAYTEMIGAVIELLAYYSKDEVIPTYYGDILTGKLARDEDAVKMMDLLFDTICYEVGGNYFGFDAGFGDLFYCLPRLALKKKSTDFASWYDKNEKSALKTLDRFYTGLYDAENA